jgi:hypothetical protein
MSDEGGSTKEEKTNFEAKDRWLMFAMIIGPVAALLNESVAYSLTSTACEHGSTMLLHIGTAIFLLLSLSGVFIGRALHPAGVSSDAGVSSGAIVARNDRTRWMATAAMILSVGCAVIILAMAIPTFILRSCE